MTLQERIASLNAAHIGRAPGEAPLLATRSKPQIPVKRPIVKQKSFNLPTENTVSTLAQPAIANLPSGPPPLPSRRVPPPLPARKDFQAEERRASVVSGTGSDHIAHRVTATRTKSEEDTGRIKAPAWGDCELPPLPTKADPKQRTKSITERPKPVSRAPSTASVASTITVHSNGSRPPIPPPPLPKRKSSTESQTLSNRKVPPLPNAEVLERARKASFASNCDVLAEGPALTPPLPTRRPSVPPFQVTQAIDLMENVQASNTPPPVPKASRPNLSAIQSTKPRINGQSHTALPIVNSGCMTCRDFSSADHHASLFPRQQATCLRTLAQQLTAPFPSMTDKARAIFTWLHYNIDYNVRDFFNSDLKPSTPQSTLQTGLAVCEGYAALFTNLATHAGLESLVISGHGKGFGFNALVPGSPLPPYDGNHAWNVVKIDNDEWKLIDSCWGAGHVQGAGMPYCRKFAPDRFTQSNEEFGVDHFPNNRDHFFLPGGRTLSWEEYIQINPALWPYEFERPTFFDNAKTDYSIGKDTVSPPNRKISVHQPGTVRFSFGLFCLHWTLESHTRKGPPPVFILATGGVDGRNKMFVPLEHVKANLLGTGGDMWYADVPARELGAPGEGLTLFAVTSFGNRQNARGLTVKEFNEGVGRMAMGFVGVAAWELI